MVSILKQVGAADWNREIEYVQKHSSQLVYTRSEDLARDTVWAGSLARVNTPKLLTHIGHGEGEHTVLLSGGGPHWWHKVVFLGASEEGV